MAGDGAKLVGGVSLQTSVVGKCVYPVQHPHTCGMGTWRMGTQRMGE